jgi:hypothetical protein
MRFQDLSAIVEEAVSVGVYRSRPEPAFVSRAAWGIAMKPNAQGLSRSSTCKVSTLARAEMSLGEIGDIFQPTVDALSGKRLAATLTVTGCFRDRVSTAGA